MGGATKSAVSVGYSVDAETRQHTGIVKETASRASLVFDGDGVTCRELPKHRHRCALLIAVLVVQLQPALVLQCTRGAAMLQKPAKPNRCGGLRCSHHERVQSGQCRCELLSRCTPTAAIVVVDPRERRLPTHFLFITPYTESVRFCKANRLRIRDQNGLLMFLR